MVSIVFGARPNEGSSRISSLGLPEQCAGDSELLLLASGEPVGTLPVALAEDREALERGSVRVPHCARRGPASRRFSATVRVLKTCRPSGTCARPSRAICLGARPITDLPSNTTSPGCGADQAGDRPQDRGLAGAVSAGVHPQDLPCADLEVDPVDDLDAAVGDPHLAQLESIGTSQKGVSEIGLDHRGVRWISSGVPVRSVVPSARICTPRTEVHDDAHVVLDQEHPAAEVGEHVAEDRDQVLALLLVEAGRGLVEKQEARAGGEGPRDSSRRWSPGGSEPAGSAGPLEQVEPAENAGGDLHRLLPAGAYAQRPDGDALEAAQMGKREGGLKRPGQALREQGG